MRTLLVLCAVCTVAGGLLSCSAPLPPGPDGQISLRFEGLTNDGLNIKDIYFVLDNRSSRAIFFQGTHTFRSGTYPVYSVINCSSPDSRNDELSNIPLVDFVGRPPPFIRISPGERIRLNLNDGMFNASTLVKNRGGTCTAELALRNFEMIKSSGFQPVINY
jgi:hypothetical protein